LGGGKTGLIDAIVERVVDARIDGVDLLAKRLRVVVAGGGAARIERRVEHADDLGGFVADD